MKRHREIGFILLAIVILAVVGCTVGQATIPQAEEVQAAQAAQTGDDVAGECGYNVWREILVREADRKI